MSYFFQLSLHFVLVTLLPILYIGSSGELRDDMASIVNVVSSVCVAADVITGDEAQLRRRPDVYVIGGDDATLQTDDR